MPVAIPSSGGAPPAPPPRRRPEPRLADRVARFTPGFIRAEPELALELSLSNIPTYRLRRLEEAVRRAVDHVRETDSFAGVPGAFTPLRAELALEPPEVSEPVSKLLAALRERLPPDAQQAAAAYMLGRELTPETIEGLRDLLARYGIEEEPSTLERVASSFARTLAEGAVASWEAVANGVRAAFGPGSAMGPPDARRAEALRAIGAEPRMVDVTAAELARMAEQGPASAVAAGLAALGELPGAAISEAVRGLPRGASAAELAGRGVRGLGAAVRRAGGLVQGAVAMPLVPLGLAAGGNIEDYFWSPDHHEPWTHLAFDMAGLDIDDPQHRELATALDLTAQLISTEAVGRISAGVRAARTMPLEAMPANLRAGTITRTVAERLGKTWEEWLSSPKGRRFMDDVVRRTEASDRPVTRLITEFHLPPRLAKALAYGSREERQAAFLAYVRQVPDPAFISKLEARLREITKEMTSPGMNRLRFHTLRAERLRIENTLASLLDPEPLFDFPKRSAVSAIVHDSPGSTFERALAWAVHKLHLHPERLVDELPHFPKVWLPLEPNKPANWASLNAVTLQRYLERLHVPAPTIRRVLDDMLRLRTREDQFAWVKSIGAAIDEGLGKKRVPPMLRDRLRILLHQSDEQVPRSLIEETVTGPDGKPVVVSVDVLSDARSGRPIPAISTDRLNHVTLAPVEDAIAADSIIRRAARRLVTTRAAEAILATMDTFSSMFRAQVLGPRVVAMTSRIQLEQYPRLWAFGEGFPLLYGIPIPGAVRKGVDFVLPEGLRQKWRAFLEQRNVPVPDDPSEIGAIVSEAYVRGGDVTWVQKTLSLERAGVRKLTPDEAGEVFDAIAHRMKQLSAAPEVRRLILYGVEDTARWLPENMPETFRALGADLPRAERTMQEYLERLDDYITELTGENPELRRALATGRYGPDPAEFEIIENEIASMRQTLREVTDPEVRAEVMRELEDAEARLESFRIADVEELSARLQRLYEQGKYRLPRTVHVPRGTIRGQASRSIATVFADAIRAYTNMWWSLLRLAGKADLALSRGAMYRRVYTRVFKELRDLGWRRTPAERVARMRAAYITRTAMYDLTARTSAQRALRHSVLFAAAAQEVAYTWLVRVPARHYWPIGMGVLANRVDVLMDAARLVGAIRKDPYGDERIVVPGLGKLLSLLPGVKVPEIVWGRPEGLNLVLQGLPGLSPPFGFALSEASRRFGGPFRRLSELFQPFGEDVRMFPTAILRGWELLTGEPFPLERYSIDSLRVANNRAWDLAYMSAVSDMRQEGIAPPRPEDYMTAERDPRTGKRVVSVKAYRDALDGYLDRVQERAGEYYYGIALVGFLGATVSPMSLRVTDAEREAWTRFFESLNPPKDASDEERQAFWDANRRAIDEWLGDNPESFPFTVSYIATGERKRDVAYEPVGDEERFYTSLYTGELRVLEPEEWLAKFQALESHRHYIGRLNAAIGDVPAPKLLANMYEYRRATLRYWEEWTRFRDLNPEVDAALAAARRSWGEEVPERTYELERLQETIRLLESARYLFNDGRAADLAADYKSVLGALKALYSETGVFGEPRTRRERLVSWYFDHVITPFLDTTQALQEKAREAAARGDEATAGRLYDRVRAIKDRHARVKGPDGRWYPSPEEFFYGGLSEREQRKVRIAWGSRPPTWLTTFQLEQLDYDFGAPMEEVRQALDALRDIDVAFYAAQRRADSDAEKEALDARREALRDRVVAEHGPWVRELIEMQDAPPAYRLLGSVGFGSDNETWMNMLEAARAIARDLEAHDLSARGYSERAVFLKAQLYVTIERLVDPSSPDHEPGFARLWEQVQEALFTGDDQRAGVPLYEAILFGQFNAEDYGMADLSRRVYGGD